MSEAGNKLKTVIDNFTQNSSPTDLFFATMITPTQIQLDADQGPLPEQLLVIPEHFGVLKVQIKANFHGEDHTGEVEIDNSLKAGDKVAVLRKQGKPKQYYVLGRLKNDS